MHFFCDQYTERYKLSKWYMAYGSCNFENFQNITRAHKSRNALAFIRFPIHILMFYQDYRKYYKGYHGKLNLNICFQSLGGQFYTLRVLCRYNSELLLQSFSTKKFINQNAFFGDQYTERYRLSKSHSRILKLLKSHSRSTPDLNVFCNYNGWLRYTVI